MTIRLSLMPPLCHPSCLPCRGGGEGGRKGGGGGAEEGEHQPPAATVSQAGPILSNSTTLIDTRVSKYHPMAKDFKAEAQDFLLLNH